MSFQYNNQKVSTRANNDQGPPEDPFAPRISDLDKSLITDNMGQENFMDDSFHEERQINHRKIAPQKADWGTGKKAPQSSFNMKRHSQFQTLERGSETNSLNSDRKIPEVTIKHENNLVDSVMNFFKSDSKNQRINQQKEFGYNYNQPTTRSAVDVMNKTNYHDISDISILSPGRGKIQVFHPSPVNIQRYTQNESKPNNNFHSEQFMMEDFIQNQNSMKPMDYIINNLVQQNENMKVDIKLQQEKIKKQQKVEFYQKQKINDISKQMQNLKQAHLQIKQEAYKLDIKPYVKEFKKITQKYEEKIQKMQNRNKEQEMMYQNTIEELHFQIWKLKEEATVNEQKIKNMEKEEITEFQETQVKGPFQDDTEVEKPKPEMQTETQVEMVKQELPFEDIKVTKAQLEGMSSPNSQNTQPMIENFVIKTHKVNLSDSSQVGGQQDHYSGSAPSDDESEESDDSSDDDEDNGCKTITEAPFEEDEYSVMIDKSQVNIPNSEPQVFKSEPKIGQPIQAFDQDLEDLKNKFASILKEDDPFEDPYMIKRPLSLNISKPAAVTRTVINPQQPLVKPPLLTTNNSDSDDDSSQNSQQETKRQKSEQKIQITNKIVTPRVIEVSQTHDSQESGQLQKSEPPKFDAEKVQVRNFELKSSNKKQDLDEEAMGDIGDHDSPGPFFKAHSQEKSRISQYRSSGGSIAMPIRRSDIEATFDQNLNTSGNESLRRSSIQRYEQHLNAELDVSPERDSIEPKPYSSSKKSMSLPRDESLSEPLDSHLETVEERTYEESCTDLDQSVLSQLSFSQMLVEDLKVIMQKKRDGESFVLGQQPKTRYSVIRLQKNVNNQRSPTATKVERHNVEFDQTDFETDEQNIDQDDNLRQTMQPNKQQYFKNSESINSSFPLPQQLISMASEDQYSKRSMQQYIEAGPHDNSTSMILDKSLNSNNYGDISLIQDKSYWKK